MTEQERSQFQVMQKDVSQIGKKIDSMEDKLGEIYYYIVGNKLDSSTGIIEKLKRMEATIKGLEEFKKKAIWIGVGMALPTTYGVFELFSKFLKAL